MRTIIAGSRGITQEQFNASIRHMSWIPTAVLCGMARGVDLMGKAWAEANGIPVEEYPADWDQYGKRAGYLRNAEMAKNANALFAIWDGESRGTRHMIDLMNPPKQWVTVVDLSNDPL